MNSFYDQSELLTLGFKKVGVNVLLSKKVSIYGAHLMSIGDNVRIDDFCILSGSITLGSNIHISAFSILYGSYGIVVDDFSHISTRSIIFSASDDLSGEFLISNTIPIELCNVKGGTVYLKKHSIIGAGYIVLPDLEVGEGAVVGACSLVKDSLKSRSIYGGVPAHYIKDRSKKLLELLK